MESLTTHKQSNVSYRQMFKIVPAAKTQQKTEFYRNELLIKSLTSDNLYSVDYALPIYFLFQQSLW